MNVLTAAKRVTATARMYGTIGPVARAATLVMMRMTFCILMTIMVEGGRTGLFYLLNCANF